MEEADFINSQEGKETAVAPSPLLSQSNYPLTFLELNKWFKYLFSALGQPATLITLNSFTEPEKLIILRHH